MDDELALATLRNIIVFLPNYAGHNYWCATNWGVVGHEYQCITCKTAFELNNS